MKAINKIQLQIENFEKCNFIVDTDCSLGYLYDYCCAVQAFVVGKMKEAEEIKKPVEAAPQE